MGKIIFCSDLVVRVSDSQLIEMASHDADGLELTDDEGYPVHEGYNGVIVPEITNLTEWLRASTEFRPAYPDGCVVRNEMSTYGKVGVILVVWSALVILTTFYCYYCEQRLFPKGKLKENSGGPAGGIGTNSSCCSGVGRIDSEALMKSQTAIRGGSATVSDDGVFVESSTAAGNHSPNNRDTITNNFHLSSSQSSLLSTSSFSPKKSMNLPTAYQQHNNLQSRHFPRKQSLQSTGSSPSHSANGGGVSGGGSGSYHRI